MAGGDQLLLPQRLYRAGLSQKQVVLSFYALCAIFGLAATQLTAQGKVVAFLALAIVTAAILFALARQELGNRKSEPQTPEPNHQSPHP